MALDATLAHVVGRSCESRCVLAVAGLSRFGDHRSSDPTRSAWSGGSAAIARRSSSRPTRPAAGADRDGHRGRARSIASGPGRADGRRSRRVSRPVAWGASHGVRRDDSALFFTGDENLVELAGVVEYHFDEAALPAPALRCDGRRLVRDVAAAEGVFREETGRTALEAILVAARRGIRSGPGPHASKSGWTASGLGWSSTACGSWTPIRRARLCRPIAMCRRPSPTPSGASTRPARRRPGGGGPHRPTPSRSATPPRHGPPASSPVLAARKRRSWPRSTAHAAHPALTEFRLLWDTMAATLAGRPKVILDRRAAGRRHLWLADPERWNSRLTRVLDPARAGRPMTRNPTIEPCECANAKGHAHRPEPTGHECCSQPRRIAAILLARAVVIVDQSEAAFVTEFGRPVRLIEQAGLHFKWPHQGVRIVRPPAPARHAPAREMLTRDKKNLEVAWYASWRIADVERFLRTVRTIARRLGPAGGHGRVGARGRAGWPRAGPARRGRRSVDARRDDGRPDPGAWPSRRPGNTVWRSWRSACAA